MDLVREEGRWRSAVGELSVGWTAARAGIESRARHGTPSEPNLRWIPGTYGDFRDHHVPLTERRLVELLETLRFEVRQCIPRFLPYTTGSVLPSTP